MRVLLGVIIIIFGVILSPWSILAAEIVVEQSSPITPPRVLGARGPVHWVHFLDDDRLLVADSFGLQRWDLTTEESVALTHPGQYSSWLFFSPQRDTAAFHGAGVTIVDLEGWTRRVLITSPPFEHDYPPDYPGVIEDPWQIVSLEFDPTGRFIAALTQQEGIRLVEIETGVERILSDEPPGPWAISPGGEILARTIGDTVYLWWTERTDSRSLDAAMTSISDIRFDLDGRRVAVSHDRGVSVFDIETGDLTHVIETKRPVEVFAFDDENGLLLVTSEDGEVKLEEGFSGHVLVHVRTAIPFTSVDFNIERRVAALATERHGVILAAHQSVREPRPSLPSGFGYLFRPAFTADGRYLIWGPAQHAPGLWDLEAQELARWFTGSGSDSSSTRISPDGSRVAAVSPMGVARFWDLESGLLTRLLLSETHDLGADVDAELRRVAVNMDPVGVAVFSADTGDVTTLLPDAGDGGLAFTPDGEHLVSGWATTLDGAALWSLDGALLRELPSRATQMISMRASPDGVYYLGGDWTGSLLWRPNTPDPVLLPGSYGDFRPDSTQLLLPTANLALTTIEEPAEITQFTSGMSSAYQIAAFSPDGRRFAAVTADAVCEIWSTEPRRLLMRLHGGADGSWAVHRSDGVVRRSHTDRPDPVAAETIVLEVPTNLVRQPPRYSWHSVVVFVIAITVFWVLSQQWRRRRGGGVPISRKGRLSSLWHSIRQVLILALAFVLGTELGDSLLQGGMAMGLLLMVLSLIPITIIHELGHVLAARTVGSRVFWMRVGIGPFVKSVTVRGARIDLFALPIGGLTMAATRTVHNLRRRLFLFASGGILANGLAVVVALLVLEVSRGSLNETGLAALEVFVGLSILSVVANIIPGLVRTPLGELANDGLQLWRIPRWGSDKIEEYRSVHPALRGLERLREGKFEEAVVIYESALEDFPTSWRLRHDLAVARLNLGHTEQARDIFRELLNHEKASEPRVRLFVSNNIAYATVLELSPSPADLDEADRLSAANMEHGAQLSPILGTRGSVLARVGRFNEARPFLKKAFGKDTTRVGKASNAAWLALVEASLGDVSPPARDWLSTARELAPTAIEIDLVEALLSES